MASINTVINASGDARYRARVRVVGYPLTTATFGTHKDARAWAAQIEADMHGGKYTSDAAAREHTAGEMIDRYMRDVLPVKSKKPKYIAAQRGQLLWWKRQIGDYQLIKVTPYVVIECREKLVRKGCKPATVNRYFSALSHVFTVARAQWNWVQRSPLSDVTRLSEPRGRVRFLTKEESHQLLAACRQDKKKVLHDVVYLALATGARKDELLSIEPKHVDLNAGRIVLEETKNDERRQLAISGKAMPIVAELMENVKKNQAYLLPGRARRSKARIDDEFRRACNRAGIEDFKFHDLRHTFASHMAMNGASLAAIAESLGHKTLDMVKRYAHLSESHTAQVVADMNEQLL